MKVDANIGSNLSRAASDARRLETVGYSGVATVETTNDPFFPLLLASEATTRVDLMTAIAVAFARTPMLVANIGNDLNHASGGRFVLGLGSQIKPHITKRFSMPWSSPAARMREFVLAMRAIWSCWYDDEPLEFVGEFYTHTLMTPMFKPQNTQHGAPRVFVAAVGPKMTETAGEVADGMIVHPFTTPAYLENAIMPAIERGLARAGRSREDIEISYPMFVVSGETEEQMQQVQLATRRQIAFYGSTPAYKPVLDSIGEGELHFELNAMSKQGRWAEMGDLITLGMLNEFAVVSEPASVADGIKARYGSLIDRVSVMFAQMSADSEQLLIDDLRK